MREQPLRCLWHHGVPITNLPTSAAIFIFFFGGRFIVGSPPPPPAPAPLASAPSARSCCEWPNVRPVSPM